MTARRNANALIIPLSLSLILILGQYTMANGSRLATLNIPPGASVQGNPAFEPNPLTVRAGDTIIVENKDMAPHTVTNGKDARDPTMGQLFDTSIINAGDSGEIVTSNMKPGEYPFTCMVHPYMNGILRVEAREGVQNQEETQTQQKQEWLTYENSDYGISFQYPANNWTKYEVDLQPYQVVYFSTNETVGGLFDARPVAVASVYVEPTTDKNLSQSIQTFSDKVKGDPSKYRIINSTLVDLTSRNDSAYQVIYYDYGNERSTKVMETWLIKDNYQYRLFYGSDPGRYDFYLPAAKRMVDTFEITNTTNYFSSQPSQSNQSEQINSSDLANQTYNQCLEIAGKDICDYMFQR